LDNEVKKNEMDSSYSMHEGKEKSAQNICWKILSEKPFERRGHKWEDNILIDLKEIGFECGLDSSGVSQYLSIGSRGVPL
jgi:hypothetical protein